MQTSALLWEGMVRAIYRAEWGFDIHFSSQKAAWNIHKVVCVAPERQSPVQSPTIQSPDVQDSLNDLD